MRKALPVLAEDADILKQRLQHERDGRKKPRLQMLYLLASGQAQTRMAGGVGDLVLQARARLPFRPLDLDLTLVPSLKLPTADKDRGLGTGEVDFGGIVVLTKAFSEARKLHFNVGYTATGKVPEVKLKDVLFIGLAGETTIPGLAEERLQFVAEVFGTSKEEEDGRGDIQGRLGLRYLAVEDLVLDAAIGRSFTARPQVEFFATVGLTWTFDAPWKRRTSPSAPCSHAPPARVDALPCEHPAGAVRLTKVTIEEASVRLQLTATAPTAACPHCAASSSSIVAISATRRTSRGGRTRFVSSWRSGTACAGTPPVRAACSRRACRT